MTGREIGLFLSAAPGGGAPPFLRGGGRGGRPPTNRGGGPGRGKTPPGGGGGGRGEAGGGHERRRGRVRPRPSDGDDRAGERGQCRHPGERRQRRRGPER